MLIDYLENSAVWLAEKETRYQALKRQHLKFYDKDLRQEMDLLMKEVVARRREVIEELYSSLEEYRLLGKHFPALLEAFLEDNSIGKILRKKKWLLGFKPMKPKAVLSDLKKIRAKRKQVAQAKRALHSWVGKVNAKQFTATFPVLKKRLDRNLERDEVVLILDDVDRELRREGWKLQIHEPLVEKAFMRFLGKLKNAMLEQAEAEKLVTESKGKGTVAEYDAAQALEKESRRRKRYERYCRHLLISNPKYLSGLRKSKASELKGDYKLIGEIVGSVSTHKIDEKKWLADMKKRLAEEDG